jgi:hypothetical protein
VLAIVGAEYNMPATIGTLTGANADMRNGHGITLPVSGCTIESRIVFARHNFSRLQHRKKKSMIEKKQMLASSLPKKKV